MQLLLEVTISVIAEHHFKVHTTIIINSIKNPSLNFIE